MPARAAGFTLLPVIIAMTVIAAIAYSLNRSNALNASVIASRGDIQRARYAAEAGLHALNAVVQQTSCAGGFPVAATPLTDASFGGATYTAHANQATGSPLTFTSTGTYNGASVTLTRNSVYVYQAGVRTFVHQPRKILGREAYVEVDQPTHNHGSENRFEVGGNTQEALIRFDLSFFPAGSRVVSAFDALTGKLAPGAKLELYRNSPDTAIAAGSVIDTHLINRATWAEHGATFNTYDGVNPWPAPRYDIRPVATTPVERNPGWMSIDVTDAAIAWMGPAYINSGLWLRNSPSGAVPTPLLKFASSDDDEDTWRRPKLTLSYLLPCGAPPPVAPEGVSVTLIPVADSYLSSASPTSSFGSSSVLTAYTGVSETRRTLLRFSTASIPTGQRLASAHLRLASTSMTNTTTSTKNIVAHALVESWTEGLSGSSGATWLTRNGTLPWTLMMRPLGVAMATEEATGLSPPPGTFTTGWLSWNVQGLVQEWVDGITPNNGIVLISSVKDDPTLVSREGSSSQRPQLVITY